MKTCKDCKLLKTLVEFNKHSGCLLGVRPECKPCEAIRRHEKYLRTRDYVLAKTKEWAQNNKDKRRAICKKYYDANLEKERQRSLNYAKRNPWIRRANCAKRRAQILRATPKWLTVEELKQIAEFYKRCPKGYEVDHIIPLKGKNVSGLHLLANLQYLPMKENRSKSNKFY